jgi:hypothetical protein
VINHGQYQQWVNRTMLGLVAVAMFVSAQTPASKSDADQIASLMAGLSDHTRTPADVLDPNLSPSDREKNLHRLTAPHYELSIVPTEGIPAITGEFASVHVRVHFNAGNGNSLDASATAQFVKRNGAWYFSNFDFMAWPAFLVIALAVCVLVGIGYAVVVLILARRVLKQQQLGTDWILMFFPFFWPALFRKYRSN